MEAIEDMEFVMGDDPTANDAQWKKIQVNTFTRWCNEHLKVVYLYIQSLDADLGDGLKLIALLQILSHKKIGRFNKKPNFKSQKMENIAIALKFIRDEEIKFVNIDASDIFTGNLKLILGLIWTLILKYQISLPMMEDDEEAKGVTPKQALMGWIKNKMPAAMKPVNNFNTDWNDGIAIASLVEAAAPGLFPDWDDLSSDNALENATEAMKRAEEWLGVPQVITPEEITNPNVDELSVMTYVSYFPEAKLKHGAPLKPKVTSASKCSASGPGLEECGVNVAEPAKFTVFTTGSSKGKLTIELHGPKKEVIECDIQDNQDNTYSCQYVPPKEGIYEVNIQIAGVHIPSSPFKVEVGEPVDISQVECNGPGLGDTVPASFPAVFIVDASKTGSAFLHVEIVGPDDRVSRCDIKDCGNKTFVCTYIPEKEGNYKVTPIYGGQSVSDSPFTVSAVPTGDASKVKCSGPGLERPHVNHPAPFVVDITEAGKGKLNVIVKCVDGDPIPVEIAEEVKGIFTCEFTPEEMGPHEVQVLFGGNGIPGSPFKVTATASPQLDKVKLPVLEEILEAGPCVNEQFEAVIDFSEVPDYGEAILTVDVTYPCGKKEPLDVTDNHDGTFALNYTPKDLGKYILDVCYDGIPIPGSPFEFDVSEGGPEKVKIYGKGIRKGIVAVPARFTVDTKNAGPGDLSVAVEGPSKVDMDCVDNGDGTCDVTYIPIETGEFEIIVQFDNQPVPGSPFKPKILQNEEAVQVGSLSTFSIPPDDIDPKDIPSLKGVLMSPLGKKTRVDIKEGINESIFSFVPQDSGKHLLHLNKNTIAIDGSPFPVLVRDEPVIGEDSKIPLECYDCNIPKDLPDLSAVLARPNGKDIPCDVTEGPDGTISVSFVPEEPGKHLVTVFKKGKQVEDSPFVVMVEGTPDQYPQVGEPCNKDFYQPEPVEKDDVSNMMAVLRRPTGVEEPVDVKLGTDGTIALSFVPTESGEHLASVKTNGHHIPHSPFSIIVADEPPLPIVGEELAVNFELPDIDLLKDIELLTGTAKSPSGKETPLDLAVAADGYTLAINYTPEEPGKHLISIKKQGKRVKGSPFEIMIGEAPSKKPTVKDVVVNLPCPDLKLPEDLEELEGKVERPNGEKDEVELSCSPDGTLDVSFTSKEPGEHIIHVAKKGNPIKDSPFPIMIGDSKPTGATVGRQCLVNLDIPEISLPDDLKDVESELVRPSGKTEPLDCKAGSDETLGVAFTPTEPGKHRINVKKHDIPVKGSPFEVNVSLNPIEFESIAPIMVNELLVEPDLLDYLEKDQPATVGSPCQASLGVVKDLNLPEDLDKLDAKVTSPSGQNIPVECKMAADESLAVCFTPEESGVHVVNVEKDKTPVAGSPFYIVAVKTLPIPKVGDKCNLDYDIEDLILPKDLDDLEATVTGPSGTKEPMVCSSTAENTLSLEFTPNETGKHIIDVTKLGEPVEGSPFEVTVCAQGNISPCDVGLVLPGVQLPEDFEHLEGSFVSPAGVEGPVEIQLGPDNTIVVSFLPKESGTHYIHIKKDGKEVGDSPYEVSVTIEEAGDTKPDASKVKCTGAGIRGGRPGKEATFTVDTRDAGNAKLGLSIEGPSNVKINCLGNKDKTRSVYYTASKPGDYVIKVMYADQHVPGSPFTSHISDDEISDMLMFPSDKSQSPQNFVINFSGSGDLNASITRPSGIEDDAEVVETDTDTYTVRFAPKETGKHLVHVKTEGGDISGSPFQVMVEVPAAGECQVYGSGLEEGIAGQPCKFTVVTRDAGPGGLGVAVEGPGKADISCDDKGDGSCEITWYPMEAGEFTVQVRFADKPIGRSPYKLFVQTADVSGDASKCAPQGLGLKRATVGRSAEFKVDASQAGRGSIMVGIEGPGVPAKEIIVKHMGENVYTISYVLEERGKYVVQVIWAGKDIPGSPFHVTV